MIELAYLALICISAFSLGKKILNRFKVKITFLEAIVFSIAIGFGILSYLTFFLGIFGLLYKIIFVPLIILPLIFSKNEILYLIKGVSIKNIIKLNKLNLSLLIIFALFVFMNIFASFSPPYLWDELQHNIAVPKIYARHHRIINTEDLFWSYYPFNINLLFVIGLLLKNSILAKLFIFTYGTLLALGIFAFSYRFFNIRIALLASLTYYTLPMISAHISSTYTDIGAAFYIFLAFYCLILFYTNSKFFYLSSVFSGLAIASKHTALIYLVPIFIGILYKLISYKFFPGGKEFKIIFKKTIIYFLIVLLLAMPYYIRSYIYTKNPVFPYLSNLFGYEFWSPEMINSFFKNAVSNVYEERSIPKFLTIFWDLTMNPLKYDLLLGFGFIFLAFIPLIIFMRSDKISIYLVAYSVIGMAMWYFTPLLLRTLMIYPMLSVLSAVIIHSLSNERILKYLVIFAFTFSLLFNSALWYGVNSKKFHYISGLESEQDFYSKLKDHNGYKVFDYANKNLAKNSKILLFRESRGFLSDIDYIVGTPKMQNLIEYKNSFELYKTLKGLKVTHILVNTMVEIYKPDGYYSNQAVEVMQKTLNRHARLLFEDKGIYLYELQ